MIKNEVGAEIRRLRRANAFTLEALAHQADMGLTYLKELEAGEKQPTVTTLFKLAEALGVTPDRLIMPAYEKWLKQKQP